MQQKPFSLLWIAVLAVLTALGPFSIDMYLSALPTMAKDLSVSTAQIANSLPAYFIGLALGQLVYGPVSDHFGRRKPLFFGLTLYVLASAVCVFAMHLEVLLIARIAQALGGCVGVVVARSAIRDRLNGTDAAHAFSLLMIVQGVAPIVAPLIGSLMLWAFNWRSIFVVLLVLGIISMIVSYFRFPETLPPERRQKHTVASALKSYIYLCQDRSFIVPALASGILMGMLFTYINSASEILIDHLGVSSGVFALLFGVNACGIIAVSNLNRFLIKRYDSLELLKLGSSIQFLGAIVLSAFVFSQHIALWSVMLGLFMIVACVGFIGPNATVLALSKQGQRAGQASALLGALQFAFGLVSGAILYLLPLKLEVSVSIVMILYSVIGGILVRQIQPIKSHHIA
ncbi:multidrug effflux MFS transporter [Acinetobacter brisouii]